MRSNHDSKRYHRDNFRDPPTGGCKASKIYHRSRQSTRIIYNHLKLLKIFGISWKKLVTVFFLFVAPHCMSMLNMWARIARLRWKDKPPKKIANIGIHLKFSTSEAHSPFSSRRYRITARQIFVRTLKTRMTERKIFQDCM